MPRLSFAQFTMRRRFLQEAWQQQSALYTTIPPNQQHSLHAYYRPTEDLEHHELRTHWQTIASQDPSLPSRASKAFHRLHLAQEQANGDEQRFRQLISRRFYPHRGKPTGKVRVGAVARPDVDIDQLVRALMQQVKEERETA